MTMWFKKFLNIIADALPPKPSPNLLDNLTKLDPNKFYVENVRSILNVNYKRAIEVCQTGVQQGIFQECIEVLCPDGTVAKTAVSEAELPETVPCVEEVDGDYVEREYGIEELKKSTYYRFR